jgi:hypothetical protein
VTRDVRVSWDDGSTRDDVLKCLRQAEHVIQARALAEGRAIIGIQF